MNITFLGTGAGKPSLQRNVTSNVLDLTKERQEMWLFDCGEATSHQIQRLQRKESKEQCELPNITLQKISKIFITHLHGDHIFGLFGLLTSRSMSGCKKPLTLYGPKGIEKILTTVIEITESFMMFPLEIIELEANSDPSIPFLVFEDETFKVTVIELQHRVQSFAYRIEEKESIGKLDVQALLQIGVQDHTIYQQLKDQQTVTLENGQILKPQDYLKAPQKGKTVVIFGDTYPCTNAVTIAQNADFILHEATYSQEFEVLALERAHSTTAQTATTAKNANAKKLYFTHISARYHHPEDQKQLVNECRAIFPESYITQDLLRIEI